MELNVQHLTWMSWYQLGLKYAGGDWHIKTLIIKANIEIGAIKYFTPVTIAYLQVSSSFDLIYV